MSYEDHFARVEEDFVGFGERPHFSTFTADRSFQSSNLDETPDIASEVTVGKDVETRYEVKKSSQRSPKHGGSAGKHDVYQQLPAHKYLNIANPTWSNWARQQRGRRRSSSSPSASVGSSGRKKYICEKCNDVFTRSSDLRVHRDTMHAGEKKYKCKDCGKLFSQKGSLNRHMAQVPHGEFKYRCPRCGTIFVYKEYLMTHLKFSINCIKQDDHYSPTQSSLLSSLSEGSAGGESSYQPIYRSGPPGLRGNPSYPRVFSKPSPGLKIPHS